MGAMLVRQEPASASDVRRELALDLDQHGVCAETIDEVSLVATELIGNAVRHCDAAADVELGVNWTVHPEEVLVSVEDCGPGLPVVRDVDTDATSGRGMRIVRALSSEWGVERTDRGKRVWARIPLAS